MHVLRAEDLTRRLADMLEDNGKDWDQYKDLIKCVFSCNDLEATGNKSKYTAK